MPLRRWPLVFSALVVGSMAPDFEYFFGLTRPASHSFPGVVTFTFPLALLVLVLFHTIVKRPLISLLSRGLQRRVLGPSRQFSWMPAARLWLILLSLVVGIASHIFCDGFTHPDGWAMAYFPGLRDAVIIGPYHTVYIYELMQYGGTFAGALVLFIYFLRWYRHAPQADALPPQLSPAAKWCILLTMLGTAVVIAWLGGDAGAYRLLLRGTGVVRFTAAFIITAITVAAAELLGFSLIWRVFLACNPQGRTAKLMREV
jgi:Domain of unknown function (DUF4184)